MMTSVKKSKTLEVHRLTKREGETFFVRTGEETKWLGIRRKDSECVQHHVYCDHVSNQQLYMVDVVSEEDQAKEFVPCEAKTAKGNELVQDEDVRVVLKRRRPQCYDRQ